MAYLFSLDEADCPDLVAVPEALQLADGGTQHFVLDAGDAFAGLVYVLLGSATGTGPTPVGAVSLPLALDAYFKLTLKPLASPVQTPLGFLDAQGRAETELFLPSQLDPALAGIVLQHAYLVADVSSGIEWVHASRAEPLELYEPAP